MDLQCHDGTVVKANAFTMVSSCTLLRNMFEEFGILSPVVIDAISPMMIKVAVDVIHGLKRPGDLSLSELDACYHGFDFLGCTILGKKMMARLWQLVSKSNDKDTFFRFADRLMASEMHARDLLNALKSLCPKWNDFKEIFRHIQLSEHIAMFCMWRLCRFFPAHLVFDAILDAYPRSLLTFETCVKILGSYRTGVYHHPDEVIISMNKILSKFKDDEKAIHIQTICDAFCMYEASPTSKLIATTLTFSNQPKSSVLLKIYDPFRGSKVLRARRFLNATVNTIDGKLAGTVDLDKLDEIQHVPATLLLRITTYSSTLPWTYDVIDHAYKVTETWREYGDLTTDYPDAILLDEPTKTDMNEERILSEALRNVDELRYIRLDFFYGHGDVRHLAIF